MLQIGDKAPDFSVPDDSGKVRTLADELGKWLVIYFYPKDNTPGCIQEASAIRDVYQAFSKLGVTILGVSKDSVESHQKFKAKYDIPFTLLSDESTEMIQDYGAWQFKVMSGKKFMGIQRMTYLLNPEGKVAKVYPRVSPAEHAQEILEDLRELMQ